MDPLAIVRSDPFISAIFASRSSSPSALLFSAFNSLARSFIAAFSSAVNPFGCLVFVADNGPGWVAVLLESAEAVLGLRPGPISFDIGVAGPHPPGAEAAWEVRAFFGKTARPSRIP